MTESDETAADRLRLAMGMHDLGVRMYRQRMSREHPEWDGADLDAEVQRWLGDTPLPSGPPVSRERLVRLGAVES